MKNISIKTARTTAGILLLLIILFLLIGSAAAIELRELTKEEIKQIKLYENPATGHQWELEVEKPEVISLIKNNYQPLESSEDFVGQGGVHNWSFRAKQGGFGLLQFNLISPEAQKVVKQKKYLFAVDLPVKKILVDEILEIELTENPSTGYRWQLKLAENKNLELLKQDYQPLGVNSEQNLNNPELKKDGTQILVGQGGIKRWTFRGLEPGYQLFTFELARSGGKAIKTIEYLVLVE